MDGPEGLLLCAALRDVMLWLEHPRGERGSLFAPGPREGADQLALPAAVDAPFAVLHRLSADAAGIDEAEIEGACRAIAEWAGELGAPATRLAFLQSAAIAAPANAALACDVGRIARDLGDHARGESWFRHAVRIARNRDWTSYVWGYVGLGVLYIRTGNLPAARAVMMRALRASRRHRLRPLAGVAHHHLFHLTTEAGRIGEAYEHAWQALRAYGPEHESLPALASDVGRFWIHLGEFSRALPLFVAAAPAIHLVNFRAIAIANAARAAAGLGDEARYNAFRSDALELISQARGRTRLEDAYEALAYADLGMKCWERAETTATAAIRLATSAGTAEIRLNAESLLVQAQAHGATEALDRRIESPSIARRGERLAGDFLSALRAVGA